MELVGGPIISNVEITRLPSKVTNLRFTQCVNLQFRCIHFHDLKWYYDDKYLNLT
jgi:hypothetical protein